MTKEEIDELVTLLRQLSLLGARAYGVGHDQDGARYSEAFMALAGILNRAGYKIVV